MIGGPRGAVGRFMRNKTEDKRGGYQLPPELEAEVGRQRLEEVEKKFRLFDADASGFINGKELGHVLRTVGLNPIESRIEELLQEYDSDSSGTLSYHEFVIMWLEMLMEAEDDELMFERAFQFFDKDGNGEISLLEFKEVLTELGEPLTEGELDLFFSLVDKNQDGRLQYDEFLGFLRGEREHVNRDLGAIAVENEKEGAAKEATKDATAKEEA